jgi:hypothetical protein
VLRRLRSSPQFGWSFTVTYAYDRQKNATHPASRELVALIYLKIHHSSIQSQYTHHLHAGTSYAHNYYGMRKKDPSAKPRVMNGPETFRTEVSIYTSPCPRQRFSRYGRQVFLKGRRSSRLIWVDSTHRT